VPVTPKNDLRTSWSKNPSGRSALWLLMNAGMKVCAADDTIGPVKGPEKHRLVVNTREGGDKLWALITHPKSLVHVKNRPAC
jgi:hypothetical protein